MMHEQRTRRSNCALALALILGLTIWASAQDGTLSSAAATSGTTMPVGTEDDDRG